MINQRGVTLVFTALIKIKQNLNNLYNEVKLHQTIRQYFFHDPIPDSGL